MAVTRSMPASRAAGRPGRGPGTFRFRRTELLWLLLTASVICGAWWLVYTAKITRSKNPVPLLNLSQVDQAEKLYPALAVFQSPGDREFVARRIFDLLTEQNGVLVNTGAIARLRVSRGDLIGNRKLEDLRKRAEDSKSNTVALLSSAEFAQIKPQLAVRDAAGFRNAFGLWAGIILASFLLVSLVWSLRGFTGPQAFLPVLLLLTGIGFTLMVTLRDPLRDTLIFVPYAQGVAIGCLVMLAAAFINWEATTAGYSFVPLLGAIVLSIALIFLGSGPTGSDARVNLGPFQPVEVIKILLVFFLAGYFAKRWPMLRQLREKRFLIPGIELPPLQYAAPVMVGVAVAVLFFYLQRDLGPALVFAAVFLSLHPP